MWPRILSFSIIYFCYLFESRLCEVDKQGALGIAKTLLNSSPQLISNLHDFKESANPGQVFRNISSVLEVLSSNIMDISSTLTKIEIFSPKDYSPELKALNEGLENIIKKLDDFAADAINVENIPNVADARTEYLNYANRIKLIYEDLQPAIKTGSKANYDFFVKQFDNSFRSATEKLFEIIMGSRTSFESSIISQYKVKVKCNPNLIIQLCITGLHLINKGLRIEGTYLGYVNYTERVTSQSENWKNKIKDLSKQCSNIIETCESKWSEYAYQQFAETHKEIGGVNKVFAERLVKDLNNVVPQRNWLAVVYNDATGYDVHAFSSMYEYKKIWDERGHDTTVFSTPKSPKLTGNDYSNFINLVNTQKEYIVSIKDCISSQFWLIKTYRYAKTHAQEIVKRFREKYQLGVVYAIYNTQAPGAAISGGTLSNTEQSWMCAKYNFKLLIYQ